jgi:hypothetical protein
MSNQATLALDGPAPAAISEERRAAFDVDRTPPAIPRLVYETLAPELGTVRRILIPAAGSGPWAAEARARWPEAHITAVEIRPEERPVLAQVCDVVVTADIRAVQAHNALAGQPFDIIADNPPFSLLTLGPCPHERLTPQGRCQVCGERKSQAEALRAYVANLRPLLAPSGLLALYWLSDLGQRATGEAARALWDKHRPLYQMRVQPVEHRQGRGVDLRSYSVWAWGHVPPPATTPYRPPPGWRTWDLPPLTKAERRQ